MNYALTEHARRMLTERGISVEWLERTLNETTLREPDPLDPSAERRYRPIPGRDGRVLRVVVDLSVEPVCVITVFFDRNMRGKL